MPSNIFPYIREWKWRVPLTKFSCKTRPLGLSLDPCPTGYLQVCDVEEMFCSVKDV